MPRPSLAAPTVPLHVTPLAALGDHTTPCRVLLVDDETEFAETLAERLRLRGYEPTVAGNGHQALARLCDGLPHLVILDMYMSGLSGMDVLKMLRFSHPEIPVIILTGHGSVREAIECQRLGAFDYLHKPTNIEDLLERMDEALSASASPAQTIRA